MKETELVFTVNGSEQKISANCVQEVISNAVGTTTSIWDSGKYVITDGFLDGKWTHKKLFSKDGKLERDWTRVFENGKVISDCEEMTDGSKNTTLYEYDEQGQIVYQKFESMNADGEITVCKRFYKNFYDGNKIDSSEITFDKDICYREYNSEGKVIRFIDSEIEGVNEFSENGDCLSSRFKKGELVSKCWTYKSDDGLVEVSKTKNFEDKSIYFEIKDSRKSSENPDRLYAVYSVTKEN